MQALLLLGLLALLILASPWWTPGRVRRRLLETRRAWRGRHRFEMPPAEPELLFVGHRLLWGRMCGQRPGKGPGWLGVLDLTGRLHVGRFLP